MDKGVWVWPSDSKGQERMLRTVSNTPRLIPALQGITRNKDGLSNPELDELLADNSNWMTLWSVRQLLSLGFIEYKVDFFGGPAKYTATDLGRNALSTMTGTPTLPPPAPVQPPPTRVAAQKTQ